MAAPVTITVTESKPLGKQGAPITDATFEVDVSTQTGKSPPPPIWQRVTNVSQDPNTMNVYAVDMSPLVRNCYNIRTSAPGFVPAAPGDCYQVGNLYDVSLNKVQ
jgi:hypothetical protein